MASTSPEELAALLLGHCLRAEQWPLSSLDALVDACLQAETASQASRALFGGVVEPLGDRFEPRLCLAYADLFSEVIARLLPEWEAQFLRDRYRRVRVPRAFGGPEPEDICVLSRVTLGADVAVTSVLLAAAKARFPKARLWLVGSRKGWELFQADPRVRHLEAPYPRSGNLRARLDVSRELARALPPGALVIDPDSRLSQTGLLPLCAEDRYLLFESRAYGQQSAARLTELAGQWVREVLEVGAQPFLAVRAADLPGHLAVSLGVGENNEKRLGESFEAEALRLLGTLDLPLLVDRGGTEQESQRVERAVAASRVPAERVRLFAGSFADFAANIASSRLYFGYDSAGQHVASVAGVPSITVFTGYPSDRFLARWRPRGKVIARPRLSPERALEQLAVAIRAFKDAA